MRHERNNKLCTDIEENNGINKCGEAESQHTLIVEFGTASALLQLGLLVGKLWPAITQRGETEQVLLGRHQGDDNRVALNGSKVGWECGVREWVLLCCEGGGGSIGAINSIHNQGEGKIYIFEMLNEKYIQTSSRFGGSYIPKKILGNENYQRCSWSHTSTFQRIIFMLKLLQMLLTFLSLYLFYHTFYKISYDNIWLATKQPLSLSVFSIFFHCHARPCMHVSPFLSFFLSCCSHLMIQKE